MIDTNKWKNLNPTSKFNFINSLINTANLDCVSKTDWEIMCMFLCGEVHFLNAQLDSYLENLKNE